MDDMLSVTRGCQSPGAVRRVGLGRGLAGRGVGAAMRLGSTGLEQAGAGRAIGAAGGAVQETTKTSTPRAFPLSAPDF